MRRSGATDVMIDNGKNGRIIGEIKFFPNTKSRLEAIEKAVISRELKKELLECRKYLNAIKKKIDRILN